MTITEHPIIFSTPMMQSILRREKTQTRRIIKPQPMWVNYPEFIMWPGDTKATPVDFKPGDHKGFWGWQKNRKTFEYCKENGPFDDFLKLCPYKIGDRLWVKETWGISHQCDTMPETERVIFYRADHNCYSDGIKQYYPDVICAYADKNELKRTESGDYMTPNHFCFPPKTWKPSIHMPRWASRFLLEITDVRIERVNSISTHDCLREGIVQTWGCFGECPPQWALDSISDKYGAPGSHLYDNRTSRENFAILWESIYGEGSWNKNPWVWVIDFKVIS